MDTIVKYFSKHRVLMGLLFGTVISSCVMFFMHSDLTRNYYLAIEKRLYDFRFRWRGPIEQSRKIVHIDIDDTSLEEIGQYPFRRTIYADLIRTLDELDASVLLFDIVFAEESLASVGSFHSIEDAEKYLDALGVNLETENAKILLSHLTRFPDDRFSKAIADAKDLRIVLSAYADNSHIEDERIDPGVWGQVMMEYIDLYRSRTGPWEGSDRRGLLKEIANKYLVSESKLTDQPEKFDQAAKRYYSVNQFRQSLDHTWVELAKSLEYSLAEDAEEIPAELEEEYSQTRNLSLGSAVTLSTSTVSADQIRNRQEVSYSVPEIRRMSKERQKQIAQKRLPKTVMFAPPIPDLLLDENESGKRVIRKNVYVGYANTYSDEVDGIIRQSRVVMQHEDRAYFYTAFLATLLYLNADFHSIEVVPGEYVRFETQGRQGGGGEVYEVPINTEGEMFVNWTSGALAYELKKVGTEEGTGLNYEISYSAQDDDGDPFVHGPLSYVLTHAIDRRQLGINLWKALVRRPLRRGVVKEDAFYWNPKGKDPKPTSFPERYMLHAQSPELWAVYRRYADQLDLVADETPLQPSPTDIEVVLLHRKQILSILKNRIKMYNDQIGEWPKVRDEALKEHDEEFEKTRKRYQSELDRIEGILSDPEPDPETKARAEKGREIIKGRLKEGEAKREGIVSKFAKAVSQAQKGIEAMEGYREGVEIKTQHLADIEARFRPIFEDAVCIVGSNASSVGDFHSTPYRPRYHGPGTLSNTINTILFGRHIRLSGHLETTLCLIFVSLFISIVVSSKGPLYSGVATLGTLGIWLVAGHIAFVNYSYMLELAGVALSGFACFGGITVYRQLTEEREKRILKGHFAKKCSPELVEKILEDPETAGAFARKIPITVLFSDLAGFTTISELLGAEAMVTYINSYHEESTRAIVAQDGYLDKFMGDGIMAFYGAPVDVDHRTRRACQAALDSLVLIDKLNVHYAETEQKPPVGVRIGISAGEAVVGYVGTEDRADYTAMGDTVNLCQRMEASNKDYGSVVMLNEVAYEEAKEDIVAREMDLIRLKGKKLPIRVFELIAMKGDELPIPQEALDEFALGRKFYNPPEMDFAQAKKHFERVLELAPDDGPSQTFVKRCDDFIENPPPEDWDGVYVTTTK